MTISSPVISDTRTHYDSKVVWTVLRISLGAISFGYTGSIIGTTLGRPISDPWISMFVLTFQERSTLFHHVHGTRHQ